MFLAPVPPAVAPGSVVGGGGAGFKIRRVAVLYEAHLYWGDTEEVILYGGGGWAGMESCLARSASGSQLMQIPRRVEESRPVLVRG